MKGPAFVKDFCKDKKKKEEKTSTACGNQSCFNKFSSFLHNNSRQKNIKLIPGMLYLCILTFR